MLIRQPIPVFLVILAIALLIYWQGMSGIFLMDDLGVLSSLGHYSHLGDGRNFLLYLLEGNTGPTGRPLSLASFYLNAQSWPAEPFAFKITNILLHLLNAIIIFTLLKKLTETIELPIKNTVWFSLLVTSLWLLHPFQITSVLYVVQRMTELSTLFMLLGLLIYLHGRDSLASKYSSIRYFWLTAGLVLAGLLAVLSKENGVLLLGYIIVIEYFFLRPLNAKTPRYFNIWLVSVIIIPFLLILTYILNDGLRETAYLARPFTLKERLLTESRVILDYLVNIFIPGFSTPSLFHDDYALSKDWLTPWTTLPSIVAIIALLAVGLLYRNRWPIVGFTVFWFLCGHLLESTVIPLEIYFEHRNYLSLLGPMAAVGYLFMIVIEKFPEKRKAGFVALGLYTALITGSLALNTSLWGSPVQMIVGWAQEHPKSSRAVEMLAILQTDFDYKINDKDLLTILENMQETESANSSYILFRELAYSCLDGKLDKQTLISAKNRISQLQFANSATLSLDAFINNWVDNKCPLVSQEDLVIFLNALFQEKTLQRGDIPHYIQYSLARIWIHERDLDKTIKYLDKAYLLKPRLGGLLMKAKIFSSAGLYDEALATLQDTHLLEKTLRERMVLALRQPEIDQAKQEILEQKLQNEAKTHDDSQHHIASQK